MRDDIQYKPVKYDVYDIHVSSLGNQYENVCESFICQQCVRMNTFDHEIPAKHVSTTKHVSM